MSNDGIWLFVISCIGFGFIPGPAMLQTVSLTLQHGRRAGLLAAFGVLLGGMVQVAAVAFGAAALLQASPMTFQFLKITGGLYLIWLGLQRLRTPMPVFAPANMTRHIVWTSAMIELTNPKSALFYLAFLLPFVDPSSSIGAGWQLLALGALANVLFSVADVICVAIAWPMRRYMRPGVPAYRWGQCIAGLLFCLLGVMALTDE